MLASCGTHQLAEEDIWRFTQHALSVYAGNTLTPPDSITTSGTSSWLKQQLDHYELTKVDFLVAVEVRMSVIQQEASA